VKPIVSFEYEKLAAVLAGLPVASPEEMFNVIFGVGQKCIPPGLVDKADQPQRLEG
jgi:hypothetical protein